MRCSLILMVVATVVAAGGLEGCKSSQSPIFFTSPDSPFPDVPVPASFTLVGPAGGRNTEHLYQSTDAVEPVVKYFSEQLPKRGWVLQSQSPGTGRALMQYAKGGEVLQIEVWNGPTIRTNARIRISAAARGATAL